MRSGLARASRSPGRLDVERQSAVAVVQIEVDEHDPAALLIGEMPGQVDRQCRRADTAAGAD